jgi:hypothetical protein
METAMSGCPLALIFPLALLSACAAPKSPDKYSVETETSMYNPHEGRPIYNTSQAIDLAEKALRQEGVDYEDRTVLVSLCDCVYTVTFEKPRDAYESCDFCVKIDAGTSRIMAVVTNQ